MLHGLLNNYILYVNSTNGAGDSDGTWVANWTAYNTTWSTDTWVANFSSYYTSTQVDTINTSQTNYINANNASVENYILYVNSTNGDGSSDSTWVANWTAYSTNGDGSSDSTWVANWTAYNTSWSLDTWVANFSSYYTSTESDVQNTSQTNYINLNNETITNTMVPYSGADKNINISFNNFSIGGGTIWFNGTHTILT